MATYCNNKCKVAPKSYRSASIACEIASFRPNFYNSIEAFRKVFLLFHGGIKSVSWKNIIHCFK